MLSVDANQTLTVVLTPSGTLKGSVEIDSIEKGGAKIVSKQAGTAAGQDVVIQTEATSDSATMTYPFVVQGEGKTTGAYHLRVILNAAVENEDHGGPADDTPGTAQPLSGFTTYFKNSVSRAALLGTIAGGTAPGDLFVALRGPGGFFVGQVNHYDKNGNLAGVLDSPLFDTGVISDVELGPHNDLFVALDINGDGGDGELVRFD
jgi:hypothetical protein